MAAVTTSSERPRRAGSVRLAAITMTSGEMLFPSVTDFSRFCLTLRVERLVLGGQIPRGLGLFQSRDLHLQVGVRGEDGVDARPGDALHEQPGAAVRKLQHAHDRSDGPDREEILETRGLGLRAPLSDEHDDPLLRERGVDGVDRLLPRDRQREDDVRKDDDVFQRQDRQDIGDRKVGVPIEPGFFFVYLDHGYASSSGLTKISISFSRRSGTRGRMISRRPRESFDFAWRELTGRGSDTDFTKVPKYRSMQEKRMPSRARVRPRFVPRTVTTRPRTATRTSAASTPGSSTQDPDLLPVVDDVDARIPRGGWGDHGIVAFHEESEEPVHLALEAGELDHRPEEPQPAHETSFPAALTESP